MSLEPSLATTALECLGIAIGLRVNRSNAFQGLHYTPR